MRERYGRPGWQKQGHAGHVVPRTYRSKVGLIDLRERKRKKKEKKREREKERKKERKKEKEKERKKERKKSEV